MEHPGGYSPKDLHFGANAQHKLVGGISKIAEAVKSTLGPCGNTVLIESPQHTHGITVTKDGVTVAKSISLIDPVENLAVRMMKEAADKTAASAGDGTTTAIVLTESLVRNGFDLLQKRNDTTDVLRDMVEITKEVVKNLKKRSKPLTKKKMVDVATISSNNDTIIGQIIAQTYDKVGKNGLVTVEKSQTSETTYETTEGLKIDRGYSSPLFINNHKKDECILDDVFVLVSDAEITNILSLEKVLKPIIADGKKLLIVAPCSQNVINTLAANVMKNNMKLCAITPPSFGYKQHELMQDLALSVGATYFSEKTGDDLSIMNFTDLGKAKKIIVSKDQTILLKDKEKQETEKINQRVSELWEAHKSTPAKPDKDFIVQRIASLTGGVGVIYVGGNTDLEQKELYDRVDDAVCAVRSALEEGILPGGGLALYDEGLRMDTFIYKSNIPNSKSIAYAIMAEALKSPMKQIFSNAGYNDQKINDFCDFEHPFNEGINVKEDHKGNLIDMGVIDPLKVTKQALQNAVSVAVTILSTNAIVTMAREITTK